MKANYDRPKKLYGTLNMQERRVGRGVGASFCRACSDEQGAVWMRWHNQWRIEGSWCDSLRPRAMPQNGAPKRFFFSL